MFIIKYSASVPRDHEAFSFECIKGYTILLGIILTDSQKYACRCRIGRYENNVVCIRQRTDKVRSSMTTNACLSEEQQLIVCIYICRTAVGSTHSLLDAINCQEKSDTIPPHETRTRLCIYKLTSLTMYRTMNPRPGQARLDRQTGSTEFTQAASPMHGTDARRRNPTL